MGGQVGGGAGVALAWAMMLVGLTASAVLSYFLGCLNGAVIVSKYILRDDVRAHGSGNAGLTNFHRTFGGKLTAVVLLLDIVKMVAAVWLSLALPGIIFGLYAGTICWPWLIWTSPIPGIVGVFLKYWSGLWCLLGHMFPVTFGFKGGKGVLSGVTLMFCLDWRMGLIALAIFLAVVVLTRYISLGSCLAAVSFPLSTWLFVSHAPLILAMSVALAGLVIFMHRGNLGRVARGEERKFSLHRKEK